MPSVFVLSTGQDACYDAAGNEISCGSSWQDAAHTNSIQWPRNRFQVTEGKVLDKLTGLIWSQDANLNGFPVTWQEALEQVCTMNQQRFLAHDDWRLPNRRELHSLMSYQAKKPALPQHHPFTNYFLGWYLTSTSAAINPSYAWSIHLEGARMFYGSKKDYRLFWPVSGQGNGALAVTGQKQCFDQQGRTMECRQSGQDGELQHGRVWPRHRFVDKGQVVHDKLTNLHWLKRATITDEPVSWQTALEMTEKLRSDTFLGINRWRLPTINELESLTDCSQAGPALPGEHPFVNLRESYWSSTTSFFETDWAWAYYMVKGALGVGYKADTGFYVWPVYS